MVWLICTGSFVFSAADINLGVSDFKCPTGHSIYPHPQRCELYYTCYNTEPTYLWQCRSNLLFDLVYNGCNWPEQTYCGNRTRPGGKYCFTFFVCFFRFLRIKKWIGLCNDVFDDAQIRPQAFSLCLQHQQLFILAWGLLRAPMMDFIRSTRTVAVPISTLVSTVKLFLL